MKPLTEQEIRAAFVNCTKGEAKRLSVPRDLAERPSDDLDAISPARCYVRGKKDAGVGARLHESLTLEEEIERTVVNLAGFIAKATA
ncbi:FBP domain-containing protein [Streptomyces sp. NPDC096354]|uniref:FBP domain-containing protein n=1 Tax=Streptomyces sp. NPDC096354 TaxID=3366088 RepID=UPI0038072D2F